MKNIKICFSMEVKLFLTDVTDECINVSVYECFNMYVCIFILGKVVHLDS